MAEQRGQTAEDQAGPGDAPEAVLPPQLAFRISLPNFEGPLDLLLHLIREHRIDILDIPIALITEKYMETLQAMKELNLDVAGEFILMAATLAHIKSRMLLPNPEPLPAEPAEQVDPREELVRRLLNYQKYKAAAELLGSQDLLERDVFTRRHRQDLSAQVQESEAGLVEVSVFKLVEALDKALKEAKVEISHQVILDHASIGDAISGLIERLKVEPKVTFFTLLLDAGERHKIVVTFLALLEMCKLGLIRIFQEEPLGDILVSARDVEALRSPVSVEDEYQ